MEPIYLDYNATTPVDPRVADAMIPYLRDHFGNPSSSHRYGAVARKAVEKARRQVADLLGCQVDEIVFTSGGSEANNQAIKGVAEAYRAKGNHIITSSVEHPAVTEVCEFLEGHGCRVTRVGVDGDGLVDPAEIEAAITPQTILITIMHANNEVGTIQPIAEIAALARRRGVLMHSDCAQSVGKIPVDVKELGVDLLTVAGHKFYGPKGVGALYVRGGVRLDKQIHGADHERNLRAGTENVLEIVGLGAASELVRQENGSDHQRVRELRDRLESGLLEHFPQLRLNGAREQRLPNTCSVSFRGLEANTILSELAGVAASAGAACHADQVDVSAVLEAMAVPVEEAMGTLRFSVGRFTTQQEIDKALEEIVSVVSRLEPGGAPVGAVEAGQEIRLTRFTHGMGCACKLRPQVLEEIVRKLPVPNDPDVMVGAASSDDAAVYRINDETALVATVDFFTPIVDDPYQFGAIAAANSLSDVYAMGGRPLFALNVVGFPSNRLPASVLQSILEGASAKAEEAGISVLGGHTVDDTEPKFGMAVTGVVHPDRVLTNADARAGDVLVLTKPIGTGILSTAMKNELLEDDALERLVATMSALNRGAAEAMAGLDVHACTDITGFGLLGHLLEMTRGSGCGARVHADEVLVLPGAFELAASGVVPGGSKDNFEYTKPWVDYAEAVTPTRRLILNDAQTSGGLLIAVAAGDAEELRTALDERGVGSARVGEVTDDAAPRISVES